MKIVKTTFHEGISQALARGHCPVCTLIAEFQEQLVSGTQPCEVSSLCNYHAWAIASSGPAEQAAQTFVQLVEQTLDPKASEAQLGCSFCARIDEHELGRSKEMIEELKRTPVQEWMKLHGSFCLRHARKLNDMLPEGPRELVVQITLRSGAELKDDLMSLLAHLRRGDRTGWGALGRAAEFLTSQRGMGRSETENARSRTS